MMATLHGVNAALRTMGFAGFGAGVAFLAWAAITALQWATGRAAK